MIYSEYRDYGESYDSMMISHPSELLKTHRDLPENYILIESKGKLKIYRPIIEDEFNQFILSSLSGGTSKLLGIYDSNTNTEFFDLIQVSKIEVKGSNGITAVLSLSGGFTWNITIVSNLVYYYPTFEGYLSWIEYILKNRHNTLKSITNVATDCKIYE